MYQCYRLQYVTSPPFLPSLTRSQEAASRPRQEYVPKRVTSRSAFDKTPSPNNYNHNFDVADNSGYSLSPAPPAYSTTSASRGQ